jgi:dolichyl-phosphate-mannose-protein mannosyltransferase
MMASEKGVLASGLESDSQSTRRRNVLSTSPIGGMVNRVEIDDKKTQIKKVRAGKFP